MEFSGILVFFILLAVFTSINKNKRQVREMKEKMEEAEERARGEVVDLRDVNKYPVEVRGEFWEETGGQDGTNNNS